LQDPGQGSGKMAEWQSGKVMKANTSSGAGDRRRRGPNHFAPWPLRHLATPPDHHAAPERAHPHPLPQPPAGLSVLAGLSAFFSLLSLLPPSSLLAAGFFSASALFL